MPFEYLCHMEIIKKIKKGIRRFMAKDDEYIDNVIDKVPSNGIVRVQIPNELYDFKAPYAIAIPNNTDISIDNSYFIRTKFLLDFPWEEKEIVYNGFLRLPRRNSKPLCRFEKIRIDDYFKMSMIFRENGMRYNLKKCRFAYCNTYKSKIELSNVVNYSYFY